MADGVLPVEGAPAAPAIDLSDLWGNSAPAGVGAVQNGAKYPRNTAQAASTPAAASTPPASAPLDLKDLWGDAGAPAVTDPAPQEPAGRSALGIIVDPFGTTGEAIKGVERGARGAAAVAARFVGADQTAQDLSQTPADLQPEVGSIGEITGAQSAAKYVYALLGESMPESAAVAGAGIAGTAAGGPVGGVAAALGTATALQTGHNVIRQELETGEANWPVAIGAGVIQGSLDVIVPMKLAGSFASELTGAITSAATKRGLATAKRVATDATIESMTETTQTALEQMQASPQNRKALFDAQTPEELALHDKLLGELADSAVGAFAAGGAMGGIGEAVEGGHTPIETPPPAGTAAPVADPGARPGVTPDDMRDDYLNRLQSMESGGNPNAQNPNSSAGGLFQFTDGTWMAYVRKYRPDLLKGRGKPQILALKQNGRLNREMAERYTAESQQSLVAAGLPVTNATLGIYHRFGPGGGEALLNAAKRDPNMKVGTVMDAAVMRANPDLTGKTVGDIVNEYEQKLGAGNTFVPGAVKTEVGYADAQRSDDKRGIPVKDMTHAERAQTMSEALSANFGPTPQDRLPGSVTSKLRTMLEDQTDANAQLDLLRRIARGEAVVNDPTVSALDAARAARSAMTDLGFDPRGVPSDVALDVSKPEFRPAPASLALEREVTEKFDTDGFAMRGDTGGRVFSQVLNRASALLNERAKKTSDKRLAGVLGRTATKANDAADALTSLTTKRKGETRSKSVLRKIVADGVKALKAEEARWKAEYATQQQAIADKGTAAGWSAKRIGATQRAAARAYDYSIGNTGSLTETAVRAYDPLAKLGERAKFTKATLAAMTELDNAMSKAGFAENRRLRTEYGAMDRRQRADIEVSSRASETAANARAKAMQTERLAVSERQIIDAERQRSEEAKTAAEQKRTGIPNPNRQFRTTLETLRAEPVETQAERREAETQGNKFVDMILRNQALAAPKAWIDWLVRRGLPNQYIARTYGQVFDNVNYAGAWMNPVLARLKASQAGDADRRAHVDAASTALDSAVAKLHAAAGPGAHDATALHETLSHLAFRATMYEAHMVNPNGSEIVDFQPTLMRAGEEWNGKPLEHDGINSHIPEARHTLVKALHDEFRATPKPVRDAYAELRDHIRRGDNELLLRAINARRRQVGLPIVQNLTIALDVNHPANAQLTAETKAALQTVRDGRRRGDYFPLSREGKFGVYAAEQQTFTADTEKGVIAAFKTATEADPHLRPGGRVAAPQAVYSGGMWHVEAERPYFRLFDTAREAEAVRAQLEGLQTGIGLPMDDPALRDFKPTVVGAVMQQDQHVFASAGLNNAQAAAIQELASDSLELRNLLIGLLPDRNIATGLKSRDNVLGVQPKLLDIMRKRSMMVANQIGELLTRPDVRQVFQDMQAQKDALETKATAAKTQSERLRMQGRAHRQTSLLNFLREADAAEAAKSSDFWKSFNSIGSRTATLWFLSGLSHTIINTLQVGTYGTGQFAGLYGIKGVRSLARNNARAMGLVVAASRRGGMDLGYFADGTVLDARLFDAPADPRLHDFATVANVPADVGGYRINVDTGKADTLLLSQFEVEQYLDGKFNVDQIRIISKSREGRHLGSTFYEQIDPIRLAAGNLGEAVSDRGKQVFNRFEKIMNYLPSAAEYANRLSVVLAVAESEAIRRNKATGYNATEIADIESVAGDMNARINVDYSTANRSLLQRKVGVFAQFTSFPITMMLENALMMKSLYAPGNGYETRGHAAAALAGQTVMLGALVGGVGATPFLAFVGIKLAMSLVADMWGGDDQDEYLARVKKLGFEAAFEGQVRSLLGGNAADLLFEGPVSVALGVSLKNRLGVQTPPMMIRDGSLTDGAAGIQKLAFELAGPVPSLIAGFADAYQKWPTLTTEQKVEKLAPKFIKNAAQAYKYTNRGLVDGRGRTLISPEEFSWTNGMLQQLLGFTPLKVSDFYERQGALYGLTTESNAGRDLIYQRASSGLATGAETRAAIREYNKANPGNRITGTSLSASIRSNKKAAAQFKRTGGLPNNDPKSAALVKDIYGAP